MASCVGIVFAFLGFINAVASQPQPYVYNGFLAKIEDYPFMASVRIVDIHICGGSILTASVVLTAAHCLVTDILISYSVKVGSSRHSEGTSHDVLHILRHPKFDKATGENDIALIKLKTKLKFGPTVAKGVMAAAIVEAGSPGIMVGFGSYNLTENSTSLRHSAMEIDQRLICVETFLERPDVIVSDDFESDQIICATNWKGQNMCYADSGGPLLVKGRKSLLILGVASTGNCGELDPNVFMSVPYFMNWLDIEIPKMVAITDRDRSDLKR